MRFHDRTEAGHRLAAGLDNLKNGGEFLILGLPRGGVLVAAAAAERLGAPLDVFTVRKIGAPGHEELAMGAVAGGGVVVRNEDILRALRLPEEAFQRAAQIQRVEVERRENLYRRGRPPRDLHGGRLILIDDGLATGASMKAAIEAARQNRPARLVAAVPVAAPATAAWFRTFLRRPGEEFVCMYEPPTFESVGRWYEDFRQVEDAQVEALLAAAAERCGERVF